MLNPALQKVQAVSLGDVHAGADTRPVEAPAPSTWILKDLSDSTGAQVELCPRGSATAPCLQQGRSVGSELPESSDSVTHWDRAIPKTSALQIPEGNTSLEELQA